ncbi:unnamed protein product, partial [Effrenium voratum]
AMGVSVKGVVDLDCRVPLPRALSDACDACGGEWSSCGRLQWRFLAQEAARMIRQLECHTTLTAAVSPACVCGRDPSRIFGSDAEVAPRAGLGAAGGATRRVLDGSHFDLGLGHAWDIAEVLAKLLEEHQHRSTCAEPRLPGS